jgi:hypothetical protein
METPQRAEITQTPDNGEPEVTSSETPGAPVKAPRPPLAAQLDTIARNLNPELAMAAIMVNDPDQTAALAKFAEGKMSYAEMRGLCG